MEESLDEIEEGDRKWVETVREFYEPFAKDLKQAGNEMEDLKKAASPPTRPVPSAARGSSSRSGAASAGSWRASGTRLQVHAEPGDSAQAEPEPAGVTCDKCGRPMVYKQSRFGRFIGCSGYPECKNIKPITLGIACPQEGCGGELTERRSKRGRAYFGCSNFPTCRFVVWQRPVADAVPEVRRALRHRARRPGQAMAACWREGCDYRREAESA